MSDRWVGRAQFLSSRLIQIKARWVRLGTMRPSVVRLQRMIFIVDDDESMRDSLQLLLECAGFEVRIWLVPGIPRRRPHRRRRLSDPRCSHEGMNGLDLLELMRGRGEGPHHPDHRASRYGNPEPGSGCRGARGRRKTI